MKTNLNKKRIDDAYEHIAKTDYSDFNYKVVYGKSGKGSEIKIRPAKDDHKHPNFLILKSQDKLTDGWYLEVIIMHRTDRWCPYINLNMYIPDYDTLDYSNANELIEKEIKRYMTADSTDLFKYIKNIDSISCSRTKAALDHIFAEFKIWVG